jgi:hypothetical protein
MKANWLSIVRWMAIASIVGCAPGEGAERPAQSPDLPPVREAEPTSEVPPAPSATPPSIPVNSSSAATLAGPKDPLLTGDPEDCGPARDNPHGVRSAAPRLDGSCQVCERAPEALPSCSTKERAAVTRARDLKTRAGQSVHLQGTLGVGNFFCTKRGGPCACSNRCGAPLLLTRSTDTQPISLTSTNEPLSCSGDEASVCCPFELAGQQRSVEIIAVGTWHEPSAAAPQGDPSAEPHLEVAKLCRL